MPKSKQTKIDKIRTLLERPSGAKLDAICKATGWQPHSTRAAISGLRKAGHSVERTPVASDAGSIYRIVVTSEVGA